MAGSKPRRNFSMHDGLPLGLAFFEATTASMANEIEPHDVKTFQQDFHNFTVFSTAPHNAILMGLCVKAMQLISGAYQGETGTASSLLVGARGIGKSYTCLAFCQSCAALLPNVSCAWINFYGYASENHPLRSQSIVAIILTKLAGVDNATRLIKEAGTTTGVVLLDWLKDNGQYLFIIVDELDELYRVDDDRKNALNILADLQYWGSSGRKHLCVVCCSSSARLPMLISANSREEDEFKLLEKGVPDLNETKYQLWLVQPPSSVDLTALSEIVCQCLGQTLSEGDLRCIAFLAGTNLREVNATLRSARSSNNKQFSPVSNTLERSRTAQRFLMALEEFLYTKNKKLMKSLISPDGVIDIHAVCHTSWEDEFMP